ncbi:unnamed protein product [Phytophthora lilii]|uniref:Unnamed protein product n=1 Tax=Phytophthora lilii TaxID=2077276 RepID=A0A9W6UAG8_9STRA|nr:unnamed protein product [Phytophthora lilii]
MDAWRALFPWCKWLRGRLQLQKPSADAGGARAAAAWLQVTLPKHQRNASSDLLPTIRESLALLAIVAVADLQAFGAILREKCGLDADLSRLRKLQLIFVLDDHSGRSVVWPETVCKALLAWEGASVSEDFLLTKEEVERVAAKHMGQPLPKVDIPFCLHFAPRDINLVGLQQYLQSVQRVLTAVMHSGEDQENEVTPLAREDNQEHGHEETRSCSRIWPFVFKAVELNLREFELNESVARALKELVMLGARVSCLQLPLKATDFLSEDECPRQPLAECFLAITGGGSRSRLFSSTFALEPQHDECDVDEPSSSVETIVINDVETDDRRFAALCSALRGASGAHELVLEYAFAQDSREARALKWKWLAYALFTPNDEKSSVKKLVINELQLLADDVEAIASVVHRGKPAQELLDPLWAEHEAIQREVLLVESDGKHIKDQQEWGDDEADGDDMVQLRKGTVVYLEPLCSSQDEWLQASIVLEKDAAFAVMNSARSDNGVKSGVADEWVEILVPGYGKCWVHPEAVQAKYVSDSHSPPWSGITDLALVAQVSKSSADKVLTQFFELVGHDIINLSLHTNILGEQGLGSILRSCPSLRRLHLIGAQVEDMFAFTHGYDVGYCQIEALSLEHFHLSAANLKAFAEVLSDPEREAARHLRELCIGKLKIQDIDSSIADYESMIETFKHMLDTNTTLEHLKLYIEGDFYTRFVNGFTAHDGEQLPPVGLPCSSKAAFISALCSKKNRFDQLIGEHLLRQIFRYAAKEVIREVTIMNY